MSRTPQQAATDVVREGVADPGPEGRVRQGARTAARPAVLPSGRA